MNLTKTAWALVPFLSLMVAGCGGGSAGDRANRGAFQVNLISTGQGQIYPYRIRQVDSQGQPTSTVLSIESADTLHQNANANNGVLPVASFPTTATLPNGQPGNQYIYMRFSNKVQIESVLSNLLANATTNSGLTTAVSLLAYDPNSESTTVLRGKGFVGGYTYFNRSGVLQLTQAVADDNGVVTVLDSEASGFPLGFTNDVALVNPASFVFVADTDDDLDTIETFDPLSQNILLRLIVTNAVRNTDGKVLEQEVCTATTVGADPNPPNVLGYLPSNPLQISPGNGEIDVDPQTQVRIRFNKPVQPTEVGTFFSTLNLTPASGGVALNVTVSAQTFSVLYYADPADYSNLCDYIVTPSYNLPGETDVVVSVNASSIHGLNGDVLGTNITTQFKTGEGPGIVNAPVSPDVVYIGVGGPNPGVAVIDLNGFGQGTNGLDPDPITGKPTKQPNETNWPNNPNIGQNGVSPSLSVGSSTLDAGSNGILTLVQDTKGETLLLRKPLVGRVTDIHVGPPLDLVFNNQNINVNANGANQVNPVSLAIMPGNSITVSPHPNPPRLVFPPPNPSRAIFAEEPSVTSSQGGGLVTSSPPCSASPVNQLVGGFKGYSPHFLQGVFYGPQAPPASPPPPPPYCPYTSRQQIGNFLYVLDRENNRVLVVNSNRFTVMDSPRLSDPINMTMSPTLALLAVASFASSTVSFIDTDPQSPTFNTVVGETKVADGPTTVAWQPDGEAVLALSTPSNTLTVLQASDFSIITEVSGNLAQPFDLAVTERYLTNGNLSGVFYAYILNENGSIAVYESGPSGVNGIGFNDMIGTVDLIFRQARSVQLDYTSALGGIYVSHVDDSGVGKVSRLELTASPTGQQPTNQLSSGFILPPTFRQKQWTVTQAFGGSDPNLPLNQRLSGNSPIDVAFDEMLNAGASGNQLTPFNGGVGQSFILHSSKGSALLQPLAIAPSAPYSPRYMFIALNDTGKVDVFDLKTEAKITSIDVPGISMLASYWRQ